MPTKLLSWGTSLAATAILGIAGAASAQVFSNGDILNEFGSLQLNNVDFDGLPSVLFVPEIGGSGPAEPGELAREFTAIAGNTGAFSGFNGGVNGGFPTPSSIRSFNASIDTNGFTAGPTGNTFIELPAAGVLTSGALLALDQSTIQVFAAPGDPVLPGLPGLEAGEFLFRATGSIRDVATGETVPIRYDFTAQGLFDPEGDGRTVVGSFSGTKIVVEMVPEPSSFLGLMVLGGFVAAGAMKRKNSNLN